MRFKSAPFTTVGISQEAWAKQQALIQMCDAEIGWFGTVGEEYIDGDKCYFVEDIYVPEQAVSVGAVQHLGDELLQFMMQHADIAHKMNYYGHSHVNGDVFTSHTDLTQIYSWKDYGLPFMISYIGNKRGEAICRLDQFAPRHLTSQVDLVVSPPEEIMDWAYEQVAQQVEIHESVWRGNKRVGDKIKKARGSYDTLVR